MCLLQLDKKKKNNSAVFFLKKRVLFCCFKTKKTCFFLKKTFVLKQAHISIRQALSIGATLYAQLAQNRECPHGTSM